MATKTWYLTNTAVSTIYQELSETSPGALATTSPTAGWTVGKTGATNYSEFRARTERLANTFGTTALPDGSIDTTNGDCFRTTDAYTGRFAAGTWTFNFVVRAVTAGSTMDGAATFRLFRSTNATGAGATEITSGIQTGSTVTNLVTSADQTSTLGVSLGQLDLVGEYLFVQVAWKITGAGGANTEDCILRIGTTGTLVTSPDFTLAAAPAAGALNLTGPVAVLALTMGVAAGTLGFTGQSVGVAFSGPSTGALTLTGETPTLVVAGGTEVPMPVGAGALTINGQAASLAFIDPVPSGSLAFSGPAPSITAPEGPTLQPAAGSLAFTGQNIGVAFGGPSTGSLTFTGQVPTLSVLAGLSSLPSEAALTLSGPAPSLGLMFPPAAGSLAFTGNAPTVLGGGAYGPDAAALTLNGPAPTLVLTSTGGVTAYPAAGALALSGQPAGVAFGGPPTGTLRFTGVAPSAIIAGTPVAVTMTPAAASLTLTGQYFGQRFGGFATANLVLTGQTPTVIVAGSGATTLRPAEAALALGGQTPVASIWEGPRQPAGGTLTLSGPVPVLAAGLSPTAGALTFTGQAPTGQRGFVVLPAAGALGITGPVPLASTGFAFAPAAATLRLDGQLLDPVLGPYGYTPVPAALGLLAGQAPTLLFGISQPAGVLTLTGEAPTIGHATIPPAGTLTLTGQAPATAPTIGVPVGTLTLTGTTPTPLTTGNGFFTVAAATLSFSGTVSLPHVSPAVYEVHGQRRYTMPGRPRRFEMPPRTRTFLMPRRGTNTLLT